MDPDLFPFPFSSLASWFLNTVRCQHPTLTSFYKHAASILPLLFPQARCQHPTPTCFHKHAASILPLPVSTNTPPAFYSILFPKTLYQHPTSFLSEHAASILPLPVETAFYAYLCVIFKQFASTFLNQHSTFVETFIAHAAGIIPPYQHIYTLPAIYSWYTSRRLSEDNLFSVCWAGGGVRIQPYIFCAPLIMS